MDLIRLTPENIEREHVCCAISNNRDCQVAAKKAWLRERFADGLVFCKGDVRGKCFIEYIPAERAWAPVEAEGYLYVDCLWVSGQFKGHGYADLLLDDCLAEAKRTNRRGIVALSSPKKRPFLSDGDYLRHRGFRSADAAEPYFELLYLPLDASAPAPRFRDKARAGRDDSQGFVLYYAHQCPYTAKYVPLIEAAARAMGLPFRAVHLTTGEEARNAPTPFPTYSLFYEGAFVTHEILSEKKFLQIAKEKTNKE